MRRALRLLAACAPFALILAASSPARADVVSGGVGLIGGVGGNFLGKPGDKSFSINGVQTQDDPTSYPGFGGVNYGYGLAFDLRFIGVVGLEVDVMKQQDKGHADWDFTFNGVKKSYKIEIGQDAWHIPVLVKGVLPLPLFAPMAFLGFDFVRPGSGTGSITPEPAPFTATAHADNYTMLMFGIGFELKPPIPGVDLRIPFQLRAAHNGGTSDKLMDRQKLTTNGPVITGSEYNSAWEWQAMATLGAQVYF